VIRLEFRRDLAEAIDEVLACPPGRAFVLRIEHDDGCPMITGQINPECTCREAQLSIAEVP
jgi:hypothetical protein